MHLNGNDIFREFRQFWFRRLGNVGVVLISAVAPLTPLLIGGFLVATTSTSAQAKPSRDELVIVQVEEVYEEVVPSRQQEADYQQQAQFPDYRNNDRYILYVPTYTPEILEFVRGVVPDAGRVPLAAYGGNYRGRRDGIVVGEYDFDRARQGARRLMREGIVAELIPLGSESVLPPQSSQFVLYVTARSRREAQRLLGRIRRTIEPNATRRGNRITVGQFSRRADALLVARELESELDIPVNRIFIDDSDFINAPDSGDRSPVTSSENDSYMVVIPGGQEELPIIESQVKQMAQTLGSNPEIYQAEDGNGSYIVVGPFEERLTAEQWERYLQEFGMKNARISQNI